MSGCANDVVDNCVHVYASDGLCVHENVSMCVYVYMCMCVIACMHVHVVRLCVKNHIEVRVSTRV